MDLREHKNAIKRFLAICLGSCSHLTLLRAIIRDHGFKICEGIDKLYVDVAYLQWQMVGVVRTQE